MSVWIKNVLNVQNNVFCCMVVSVLGSDKYLNTTTLKIWNTGWNTNTLKSVSDGHLKV